MNTINSIINRVISGNSSPEDQQALAQWLAQAAENQSEFQRRQAIWQKAASLKIEREVDLDAAWSDFQNKVATMPIRKKQSAWQIAAGLALIAGMVVLLSLVYQLPAEGQQMARMQGGASAVEIIPQITETPIYTVDAIVSTQGKIKFYHEQKQQRHAAGSKLEYTTQGSARAFYLPDSTVVFLNDHSSLVYTTDFGRKHRAVSLSGEAYFEVTEGSIPFTVACANTLIKGFKSTFTIREDKKLGQVEVLCVSGLLEFSGRGKKKCKPLSIVSGGKGIYTKEAVLLKEKNKNKVYKWWQKRNLRASLHSFFKKIKKIFK